MKLPSDLGQLTYCTNIHAGEPFDDVMDSLAANLPGIRAAVCPDEPLGVGLRLGGQAVDALASPAALERLTSFLSGENYYVFTLNGFPYGAFHGQPVKDGAYRPDWSDPVRLGYTNHLADILAKLLPDGHAGSISTVPATFKPWASNMIDQITENLVTHVAHLVQIRQNTGKVIALALEPEPFCYLETIEETVRFFKESLLSQRSIDLLAKLSGLNPAQADEAMHRHIGVCYDVCHAAVEFEDAKDSISVLRNAGIRIEKLQLSSALRLAPATQATLDALKRFDEPVYLHQVVQRRADGSLHRFEDIAPALKTADQVSGSEWRVHFHVPVFLAELPEFGTTQAFLAEVLELHRQEKISDHLEVETYTWDVLPPSLRKLPLDQAIGREMRWVMNELGVALPELVA